MQSYTGFNSTGQVGYDLVDTKKQSRKNGDERKLSASELKNMMEEMEASFIQPKPMAELGGELGVTLSDIGLSLNVTHSDLKRKIERSGMLDYLSALNHSIKTYVFIAGKNRCSVESYVMDVMAAQHIVGSYDNLAGWYYRDLLIRSKDGLKVSLEILEETQESLKRASLKLEEANKKIEVLTQPRITRRNNIVFSKVVPVKGSLFHDTTYRVEKEIIKQPKKDDEDYKEHYLQKLARITNGNVKSMQSALKRINCDREVLNKRMDQLSEISGDVDALINPKGQNEYNELVKHIERESYG